MPRIAAIDIETRGLKYIDGMLTIAVSHLDEGGQRVSQGFNFTYDLYHEPMSIPYIRSRLVPIIGNSDIVAFHNTTFDLAPLLGAGILLESEVRGKIFDTMLAARMAGFHVSGDNESVSLKTLCQIAKISDPQWEAMKSKRGALDDPNPKKRLAVDTILEYNCWDAVKTAQLAEILWDKNVEIYSPSDLIRWHDFCRLMSKIRARGRQLNLEATKALAAKMRERLREINQTELFPRRIHGPSDREGILNYLSREGEKSPKLTDAGKDSVDEEALLLLKAHTRPDVAHVLDQTLEARDIEKALTTFVEGMLEYADDRGFVHPNYTVAGTVSYRLSCSHPNLQAIPAKYTDIWMPYKSADYKQAELRIAAIYAQENAMARAFAENKDFHTETAILMFGDASKEHRRGAKACNFASIYGGGTQAIVDATGMDPELVDGLRKKHRQSLPLLYKTSAKATDAWKKRGYLTLMDGKRLYGTLDDLQRRSYKGFNQLIQGSVAGVIERGMQNMDAAGVDLLGQVHDSAESAPDTPDELIQECMVRAVDEEWSKRTNPATYMGVDIELKGTAPQ